MQYLDQTDYEERAARIKELMQRQRKKLSAISDTDLGYLNRYFVGSLTASDATRYRNDQIKREPNIELQANRAYERLLGELELPATIPANDGQGTASV